MEENKVIILICLGIAVMGMTVGFLIANYFCNQKLLDKEDFYGELIREIQEANLEIQKNMISEEQKLQEQVFSELLERDIRKFCLKEDYKITENGMELEFVWITYGTDKFFFANDYKTILNVIQKN